MIPAGARFGRLVAVSVIDSRHTLCRCACGKERRVRNNNLNSGGSQGCGSGCPARKTQTTGRSSK